MTPPEKIKRLVAELRDEADDCGAFRNEAGYAKLSDAARMIEAMWVLVAIADAYDNNALDDEARKHWGINDEHTNQTPAEQIELYCGRGGKRLLTLADCFAARAALEEKR